MDIKGPFLRLLLMLELGKIGVLIPQFYPEVQVGPLTF
jgi:hypothetical protein